jgi:NAD(P)-dependent dehydrogenase (short-subunit alcohol dehydrogenase family)
LSPITGASQGIGAGLVEAFLKQGYNVVATSRDVSQSLTASPSLVLVDGDIGKQETATKVVEAAIKQFPTVDVLVTNAGIFYTKPFTDFTTQDFNALVSTNLLGFLYITQLTVKQMRKQKSGSVVSISASLARTYSLPKPISAFRLSPRPLRGSRASADGCLQLEWNHLVTARPLFPQSGAEFAALIDSSGRPGWQDRPH